MTETTSKPDTESRADLPLFYRAIVPLDRGKHRHLALAEPERFGFARASHVLPAVVDEFAPACRHLPILFLPESLGPTPVFLTGFRPGRSSLIDAHGTWTGRYLPAYLRRFPFILGEVPDAEPLVCLDDTAAAIAGRPAEDAAPWDAAVCEGRRPLFEASGEDSPTLRARIALVADYAAAARRTARLGRCLQDLALLRPVTVAGHEAEEAVTHTLHGFLAVDEAALAALPDAELAGLRHAGWLGPIHAHLVSLQSLADFTRPFVEPDPPARDGPLA